MLTIAFSVLRPVGLDAEILVSAKVSARPSISFTSISPKRELSPILEAALGVSKSRKPWILYLEVLGVNGLPVCCAAVEDRLDDDPLGAVSLPGHLMPLTLVGVGLGGQRPAIRRWLFLGSPLLVTSSIALFSPVNLSTWPSSFHLLNRFIMSR